MVAPHEANLHEEFPLPREGNDFLHVGKARHGRLFEVQMPAGPEGEEGVGGMVADLRFNGHHLGPLQQFLLRHHPRPEPLADSPGGGRRIADADEFPIGRLQRQLKFRGTVRVGDSEKTDGNSRAGGGGGRAEAGSECRAGGGGGGDEVAAVHEEFGLRGGRAGGRCPRGPWRESRREGQAKGRDRGSRAAVPTDGRWRRAAGRDR